MARLAEFLVDRHCNRAALQQKREGKHGVCPEQVRRRMRMREFFNALVDRVSRANTKNKNRSYERPEEPFLPVTKRMFTRCRTFVEPQTQQQKELVHRIGNRTTRLSHHA